MVASAFSFSACAIAAGASARQRAVITINLFFIISFLEFRSPTLVSRFSRFLQRHRDSLAELKSELEGVQALRLRSGALQTELDNVEIAITKLVEERLCGGSSDSELAASGNRKSSLETQLDHLRKREHEAELELQRRLTAMSPKEKEELRERAAKIAREFGVRNISSAIPLLH